MNPINVTKEELIAILQDMIDVISDDDSFEGNIEYSFGEEKDFSVRGAYRIGNQYGQGGMRLVGTFEGEVR